MARSRCAGYCGHFVRIVGVVPIDPLRPAPHLVAQAVDVLRLGGLVAFPTETVYGLGARAFVGQPCASLDMQTQDIVMNLFPHHDEAGHHGRSDLPPKNSHEVHEA